jgi:hypothetical protein
MSRIYFHSDSDDTAVVSGSERHWASSICDKIGVGLLDPGNRFTSPQLMAALRPAPSYEMRPGSDDFIIYMRFAGSESQIELADGRKASVSSTILNTVLRVGSRPVKLMARLHGQCEIHTWVDGPNRAWMASIIEEGLRDGIMRQKMGWESVIELLRKRDDEPIVTSFSVCEQFPNVGLIDRKHLPKDDDGEIDYDAAYEMENKWELAMDGLRKSDPTLEMKPDNFDSYFFGIGVSALNVYDLMKKTEEAVK